MQKNNNEEMFTQACKLTKLCYVAQFRYTEEMFTQACKLTDLAEHLKLVEMPLDHVAVSRDNKDNGAVDYFLNKELDSVQNNIINIQEQIQEISDVLVDLYNDNDKKKEEGNINGEQPQ